MIIEKHGIDEISISPYNPRVELEKGSAEYKTIKNSLKDYGYVEPIVVNDVNMRCVGGHQRLAVLRDMGHTEIECAMVHIEDESREKVLCLALNKIKGDWDAEKLDALLRDDEITAFETGYDALPETSIDGLLEDDADDSDGIDASDIDPFDDYGEGEVPAPEEDEEVQGEVSTLVKVGPYKFKITETEYDNLIGSIRDAGIFDPQEICGELRKKLTKKEDI